MLQEKTQNPLYYGTEEVYIILTLISLICSGKRPRVFQLINFGRLVDLGSKLLSF